MPMYQTKSIAGILEPVAQQVSKLIILHEEGEDGNAMPDLERPVQAVSKAVDNLARVGKDTINSSQDSHLRSEMPRSLSVIEKASHLLEMACKEMKHDPYSQGGRDKLISGSRGILQGTTSMLVTFDKSQVSKICRDCKKVLDYLAISEVIETMEDLVQFVKDLSPCLSKVCQDVDRRRKDLLNPYHRESLSQHLEQVKTLAPILICSMKIFIQILGQEGKGTDEAVENRNYLAKRMTEEIDDIMRILEKTTREESKSGGGGGMTGFGSSSIGGISGMDGFGGSVGSMTMHEMLKQARSSSSSHSSSSSYSSQQFVQHLVETGYKIADGFDGHSKNDLLDVCGDLERVNRGGADTRQQKVPALARKMETCINSGVIDRIIQDMADITSPLKQFTDAVLSDEPMPGKRVTVEHKAQSLRMFSSRLCSTADLVAVGNARTQRRSEALRQLSSQVQTLTPQLVNAGTIRMSYPDNRAAEENFENLRRQFAEGVQGIRDICDESIDIRTFLQQTEAHIARALQACEEGIRARNPQAIVDNSALAARLANRLLMVLNKECDNSDDPALRRQVSSVGDRLKAAISPFLESSGAVSRSGGGQSGAAESWKSAAARLRDVVAEVTRLFDELNMYGLDSSRSPAAYAPPPPPPPLLIPGPPRPPLPQEVRTPGRPPMPPADTDDEEGLFVSSPGSNRPIHAAAHGLYQEVKQWDHTDNEIIAAAKKIAYLMAHLSELVRPGRGTKRELIACAKGLAEVSERITELSKELARHCTDKKIRTNLLQVCEKIPTLGTQLRVLTTVKATMMGNNMDTEEDVEAMDMLVFNAQKLNEAVRETVGAAESASIRVRSDAGFKLKWVRKPPMW